MELFLPFIPIFSANQSHIKEDCSHLWISNSSRALCWGFSSAVCFEDRLCKYSVPMGGNPSKKVVRCPADKENQAGNRESCSFPMQSVSNSCLWSDHFTMPVHPLFLRLLWEFVLTCSSSLPEITLVPAPLPGHPKWSSQDLDGSLQAR